MTPSTSDLFTAPEMRSSPSPLTMARRRLAEITHQLETLTDEGEEQGDGLFEHSEDYRRLKRELRDAEAIVAAEEAVAMGKGGRP